jgi:hypothetical protein
MPVVGQYVPQIAKDGAGAATLAKQPRLPAYQTEAEARRDERNQHSGREARKDRD